MPNLKEKWNSDGETLTQAMARVKGLVSLRDYCTANLEKRGRDTYVCPFCGSGNGSDHSAAFTVKGERFKCFSASCGKSGDIYDLAGGIIKSEDKAEQLEAVAKWAHVDGWQKGNPYGEKLEIGQVIRDDSRASAPLPAAPVEVSARIAPDYSEGRKREREYIAQAQGCIEHPDALAYLEARGIDLETARAWGLGYDPNAGRAKRADGSWCRPGRIVIPWAGSDYYHIDRATAPDVAENKYIKPRTDDVGPQPIWNPGALDGGPFFVVEGALDALAVQACGFEAVALGNAGGAALLEAIRAGKGGGCALLLLDNDEPKEDGRRPGQDAQAKLAEDMKAAGIAHLSLDAFDLAAKDAAEAWVNDRTALASTLKAWNEEGAAEIERIRDTRYADALRRLRVVDAASIADAIADYTNPVIPVPTGFVSLDRALGGGLMPRNVHVIGGGTSMGKTSHTLQVADQIAQSGAAHVLFVSVEQRAPELVAKSFSRLLSEVPDAEGRIYYAPPGCLTVYAERMAWCEDMAHSVALDRIRGYYRERIAPRMHFMEAQSQPTVSDIRTVAETLADSNGAPPVIFVDYLQLLSAPKDHEREDEKSQLKRNMVALRQLAGDLNTPVYVLAALSRDGAGRPMETDCFRDSSNIEYSSDVLLGLQLRNFKKRWEAVKESERKYLASAWTDEEKAKRIRELEIVIIKHRGGETLNGLDGGVKVWFDAPLGRFSEGGFRAER